MSDRTSKLALGLACGAFLLALYSVFKPSKEVIKEVRVETIADSTPEATEVAADTSIDTAIANLDNPIDFKPRKEFEFGTFEKQLSFWRRAFTLDTSKSLIYDRSTYFVHGISDKDSSKQAAEKIRDEFNAKGISAVLSSRKVPNTAAKVILATKSGLKQRIEKAIERSFDYSFIEDSLKAHGLDPDLKWLPILESEYDKNRGSSAGALGIWQFMRGTGRAYGLRDRRDPLASTSAFCKHKVKLNKKFNDDEALSVTAYNHGGNGVARKLKEVNGKSLKDIQHLMGFASRNFYAEFLAVVDIANNYKKYGLNVRTPEPQIFAKAVIPEQDRFHVVRRGENLSYISDKHGVTLNSVLIANNKRLHKANIIPGDTILIPIQ